MAGEFADLDIALAAVQANYDLIVAAIQDEARGGRIKDALARTVLTQFLPIAKDVAGSDWDYHVTVLSGQRTVLGLQTHYPELSDL